MNHVPTSETGVTVARLMGLEDTQECLYDRARWTRLPAAKDTTEPTVHDNVPKYLIRLVNRKSTFQHWSQLGCRKLGI